jgi:DNA-binding NarL/FixJ family response regulator
MLPKKNLVIIEDNAEVREGFSLLINSMSHYYVVGAFRSAEEALERIHAQKPHLVLMDVDLPGMSGIEATRRIKQELPKTDIIMITVFENSRTVFEALCAGATGYLTKNANPQELLQAIDQVAQGGAPMSAKIARLVVESFQKNPVSPLTERETEILSLMSKGKSYSNIAEAIDISKETVRYHIKNIYSKLQVNSKADAIEKANKEKLI